MGNSLNIFSILAGIGSLSAGVGFAFAQFKSGSNKAKDDLIETYKDQVDVGERKIKQLEEEKTTLITSHQKQINELSKQLGVLEGTVAASNQKIREYTDIFQGKSPDQQAFMEYITQATNSNAQLMKESLQVIKEIREAIIDKKKNSNILERAPGNPEN